MGVILLNKYLAKSNPQETIQEHTENLIKNYEILKKTYPNLAIDWDMLYIACLYHDLGKMNFKFQNKLTTKKKYDDEIPHGILSLAFINYEQLEEIGYSDDDIKILFHTIAYHHERDLSYEEWQLEEAIESMIKEYQQFKYHRIQDHHINDNIEDAFYIKNDRIYEKDDSEVFINYIKIKGLLNRIDYAASAHIDIERQNDFLINDMDNLLNNWKKQNSDSNWNELQRYMINNSEKNVIVVAQTGMGKTEAGLLWIGNNKGFFTLPLKTAINSIFDRVSKKIITSDFQHKIGLLHSDTYSEYLNLKSNDIDLDEYFNKTRQMSLPLTICTLDQIFDFVYRYRGFESKLATLAYSKIVIDEIQMYSSDLLAYLIIGLSYINKIGGKFAILTATLPNIVLDLLKEENIEFDTPSGAFIDESFNRHSVKVIEDDINVDYILDLYNKNKVLVICNTVKKAQEIFRKLEEKGIDRINLFHSGFIKKHRKEKEVNILKIGDRNSTDYGIWVATQVVEASLDIDFDILVTELSDINGLFQRMGRCYRNRQFTNEGYNCHVFNGGQKTCSGVEFVVDREIFDLSKSYISNIDGILTERDKVNIISTLYTTENIKHTKYYQLIKSTISYVKSIEDFEKSKSEIKKKFRNINNITVIPIEIYDQNQIEIEEYINIISLSYDKNLTLEECQVIKYNKVFARNKLMDFTVSVQYYLAEGNIIDNLKLSQYEYLPVLNCIYSKELGIEVIKNKKNEISQEDKFF